MVRFKIDIERCKGCGLCIVHCPRELLSLSLDPNSKGIHPVRISDPAQCTGCLNCTAMCPDVALSIT
ncbi:MAG: 4Fe-4S binding protein [Candidatus Latescibacterota bacterium]